jgi:phospholipase D1/2
VDDKTVIVGSANINDRSMLGLRDSEMCLLIEDSVLEPGIFNGSHYQVSRYAHSLRVALWVEHLGVLDSLVEDPVSDDTYQLWNERSRSNTALFEEAFPAIPSDNYATLALYNAAKQKLVKENRLNAVTGFLVDHPVYFLDQEKDMFVTGAAAAAVGTDVFV